MDKDDLRYFWEDHKKKIIIGGVIVLAVLGFFGYAVVKVLNKPKPVEEAPVIEEEIHIGGMDMEKTTEDIEAQIAQEKDDKYGVVWTPTGDTYVHTGEESDTLFVQFKDKDGNLVYLVMDPDVWNKAEKIAGEYTLRGTPVYFSEKVSNAYFEEDRRSVLDEFAQKKAYKKSWDTALQDAKVNRGYNKNEKVEKIADDDYDLILDEAYGVFEEALLAEEESEYTQYLNENPECVRSYDDCAVIEDFTLCDKNGEANCPFTAENFSSYFARYWDNYFANSKEVLWDKNKIVTYSDFESGIYYTNAYKQAVAFKNNESDNVILWYIDDSYDIHEELVCGRSVVTDEKAKKHSLVQETVIPENAAYFTVLKGGVIEDFIGKSKDEITIGLSDYYTETAAIPIPEDTYYIKNDTEFRLKIKFSQNISEELSPGKEIFIDGAAFDKMTISSAD